MRHGVDWLRGGWATEVRFGPSERPSLTLLSAVVCWLYAATAPTPMRFCCCGCSAIDPAIVKEFPKETDSPSLVTSLGVEARAPSARLATKETLARDGTATASGLPLALCTFARPHRAGALAHLRTRATSSRRAREHRAAAAPAAARLLQVLQRARAGAQLYRDAAALSAAAGGATSRAPRALSRLRAHRRLCHGRQAQWPSEQLSNGCDPCAGAGATKRRRSASCQQRCPTHPACRLLSQGRQDQEQEPRGASAACAAAAEL